MAITKLVMATRILQHLGAIGAEESPTAADSVAVQNCIDAVYGELTKYGSPSWDTTAIPTWAENALRDVVSLRVGHVFGVPSARIAELAQFYAPAWITLTKHSEARAETNTKYDLRNRTLENLGAIRPGEVAPEAFVECVENAIDSVFDWFGERGDIGFTSSAIPDWSFGPLVDIVSDYTARALGVTDPTQLALISGKANIGRAEIDKRMVALNATDTEEILRNRTLQHLGIINLAEQATPAQVEAAQDIIGYCFAQLKIHEVVNFEIDSIPDWAMVFLRDYCAVYCARVFGIGQEQLTLLRAESDAAFRALKAQNAMAWNGSKIKAVYY